MPTTNRPVRFRNRLRNRLLRLRWWRRGKSPDESEEEVVKEPLVWHDYTAVRAPLYWALCPAYLHNLLVLGVYCLHTWAAAIDVPHMS